MRHSKKKGDQRPLPEQDAIGSEDDFAPGVGAADGDPGVSSPLEGVADTEDQFGGTDGRSSTQTGASPVATDNAASELAGEREKYLRLAAEYDNYRKRTMKERQEAGARAQADLVKELIEALDDVARFAHVDPAATDAATLVQGVEMVEKKFMKALGGAGLEVINPVGETFDPALHEAVATEPTSAREDDHVVSRVFQPGYLFKSQLLRPARVVVKQWNG
jgi:molecular chaperone GrpE